MGELDGVSQAIGGLQASHTAIVARMDEADRGRERLREAVEGMGQAVMRMGEELRGIRSVCGDVIAMKPDVEECKDTHKTTSVLKLRVYSLERSRRDAKIVSITLAIIALVACAAFGPEKLGHLARTILEIAH